MINERYNSIDIIKGIAISLLIFLSISEIGQSPLWFEGMPEGTFSGKLIGVLFPAILFLTGMTIPFSLSKMIRDGLSSYDLLRQIFSKSLILIAAGVLMVNTTRVNAELTGLSGNLWTILLCISIFLVWNRYPERDNNFFSNNLLRLTGLAVLVFLVFRFRSGSYENNGSLIAGWWELPGLAGWGYLAAAITFISFRNSILGNLLIFLLFLTLNVLKYTGLSDFFEPVRPYFGVLLDGFIPSLVIAGSLAGIIIRKYSVNEALKPILIFSITAIFMAAAGYFLAVSYFGDGVYANPAYVLISCALTLILFLPLFLVVDIKGFLKQGTILKKTGANLFMTYIVHMLLLNLAALLYDDLFKILQTGNLLYNTIFSIVWVLVVTGVTALLIRFSIRLKF